MPQSELVFQVRLRAEEDPELLSARIGEALGCEFHPSDSNEFMSGEGVEAFPLGLWVALSHDLELPPGSENLFVLTGRLQDRIATDRDPDGPVINISDYVVGVLQCLDDEHWYVPDLDELRREAGLT